MRFRLNIQNILWCVGLYILLPASAAPASAAGAFDGSWQVAVDCASSPDGAKGYRWVFPATVRDGEFVGVYNAPNSVPSGRLTGRIGQDGSAVLTMTGRAGDPAYNLNHASGGTPIHYSVTARFGRTGGSGSRNEQRSCGLVFTRL
jgi:hypothetical protein